MEAIMKSLFTLVFSVLLLSIASASGTFAQTAPPDNERPQAESQGWVQVPSGTATSILATLNVLPSGRIWTGGSEVCLSSDDQGQTWRTMNVPQAGLIRFFDDSNAILSRDGFGVHLTSNGGESWLQGESMKLQSLTDFVTIGKDTAFAIGVAAVVRSIDSGKTWEHKDIDGNVLSIHFSDSKHGVIGCLSVGSSHGLIHRTTNGGLTWVAHQTSAHNWRDIAALNRDTIIAVSLDGYLTRTTNAGQSWKDTLIALVGNGLYSVSFIDNNVIATGAAGQVFHSSDAGYSWIQQQTPTTAGLVDAVFISDSIGIVTGYQGVILRTTNGGKSWVKPEIEKSFPIQSYPEPFTHLTTIAYTLPQSSRVTLTIFDPNGHQVAQPLVNVFQPQGSQLVPIDGSHWSPGIYLYRLTADGLSIDGRITLIR